MINVTRMISAIILGLFLWVLALIIKGFLNAGWWEYLLFVPTVVFILYAVYEIRKV